MRTTWLRRLVIAALLAATWGNPNASVMAETTPRVALLVYLKDSVSIQTAEQTVREAIGAQVSQEPRFHALRVSVDDLSTLDEMKARLQSMDNVRSVEEDDLVSLLSTIPADTEYGNQTSLPQIAAPAAWDYTTGSTAVTIAIIDTGVDGLHEDLTGHVLAGYDELTSSVIDADTDSDDNGHGTEVAGIAAASTNNHLGIAGVDWHANILPVKVLDSTGSGFSSDVANGVEYAVDHGAKVINLSLGGTDSTVMHDAVNYALAHGVVVVAASGNTGGSVLYPAAYDGVIAVGSVDSSDNVSSFSSRGSQLALVAPGENILSTQESGFHTQYGAASGTSLAAPIVSGAAGLILARNPGDDPGDVRNALTKTATKVSGMGGTNFTTAYGYGRLNLSAAVTYAPKFQASQGGQSAYPTLTAGQSANLTVSFFNTGTTSWYQGTPQPFELATNRTRDHILPFLREDVVGKSASGWINASRIRLTNARVDPGQAGTFSFWISVPQGMAPGTYREYFQPVVDGVGWLADTGLYWDITVAAATTQASWGGQSGNVTQAAGQSNQFVLNLLNSGNTTWNQATFHLGTSHNQDRISSFLREGNGPSGWTSPNRILMQDATVAPGQVGHFVFWLKTPNNLAPGTYREYFQPVVDGVGWLADKGIYWDITVPVPTPAYQVGWGGQSGNATLSAGQSAQFSLNLKNTGTATWSNGIFHLGTSHDKDRISSFLREGNGPSGWTSPNRIILQEASVAPGDVGHFVFWMKVPSGMKAGTYREYFQPVADGIGWMNDTGIYWDITVR